MSLAAPPHGVSVDNTAEAAYRLVSVEAVSAPEGCAGRDWCAYRIAQGANAIVGYRRGGSESVRVEAETIVTALNERRAWGRSKPSAKAQRAAAAAVRAGAAE